MKIVIFYNRYVMMSWGENMLVSCTNLTKYHGEKCILDHVELHIENKDKVGLLGVNGTGKSTFLKMLTGKEDYEGKIIYQKDIQINYLPQTPLYDKNDTIWQTVIKENVQVNDFEMKSSLGKFGIYDTDAKIGDLSGGQLKRVALAIALVKPCDLLVLDEPTNHLDNTMIDYLEKYLIKWNKGLVMVTHDRYFLERVVNRIIEIDHGQIYKYEANYSRYLQLKQERLKNQLESQRKRKLFLKKELEWVRAGVQARTTKSKDRLQRFEKLSQMKDVELNGQIAMIHTMSRLGKKTIELHHISKNINNKRLFDDFSYVFKQHDRIGVLGDNGTGKSTLLNMITGLIQSDTGEIVIGDTVRFGYFKQGHDDLPGQKRVIDYIQDISNDFVSDGQRMSAKDMLERFLFDAKLQYTMISRLSGGEKRRLYLLRVLMMMPNVLILDEPTNDLDIETLTVLEDYLDDFEGIIIVVSHDRYFLDRICDSLFIIKDHHISYVNGGYSINLDTATKVEKEPKNNEKKERKNRSHQIKMTYQEKKEFETIEDEITALENQVAEVEAQMNEVTDFQIISRLTQQRDDLQQRLDGKNERYLYLLELQEMINQQ